MIKKDSVDFEFSCTKYFFKCQNNLPPHFGSGTYTMNEKYIILNDTAIHTGDVSILEGAFSYEINGSYLILIQTLSVIDKKYKFDLIREF